MMIEGRHYRGILILEILGALRWGRGRHPPSLRGAVEQGLVAGFRRMVLDLSDVSTMDSSALGDLAAALTVAEDAGCRLRLSGPRPSLRVLLQSMGLETLVPVDTDEAAALRAFGSETACEATIPPAPERRRAARVPLR